MYNSNTINKYVSSVEIVKGLGSAVFNMLKAVMKILIFIKKVL